MAVRSKTHKQSLGQRGEDLVADHLSGLGWTIIERNWRCAAGEVDLVAVEPTRGYPQLVLVEVKCRSGSGYGDPLEAITVHKLARMRRVAALWRLAHSELRGRLRLDAVGVSVRRGFAPRITHLRGLG